MVFGSPSSQGTIEVVAPMLEQSVLVFPYMAHKYYPSLVQNIVCIVVDPYTDRHHHKGLYRRSSIGTIYRSAPIQGTQMEPSQSRIVCIVIGRIWIAIITRDLIGSRYHAGTVGIGVPMQGTQIDPSQSSTVSISFSVQASPSSHG